MTDYGLPNIRDSDGELAAVEHTYEWSGQEVTIKLKPPTISQHEEYEQFGDDVAAEKLVEILDRHLVEPDVGDDPTARELFCYLEGIVDYGTGGGGMAADVREELEQRASAPGN